MGRLGDDFRRRSEEQHNAALVLLEAPDFAENVVKQVQFTVGKNAANMLQLLGEMVDYLDGQKQVTEQDLRIQKFQEFNSAIRNAGAIGAATGDWSKFDELAAGLGGTGGGGEAGDGE